MNQPEYRDFYPKKLIQIGMNDRKALMSQPNYSNDTFLATHWLIALQGRVGNSIDENYQWQVYLFPTDMEGTYTWERPYYVSESLESLEKAMDLSCELEIYGRDDAIISSIIQEKII
ncbi:hypothetical protein [Pseudoneobacillus sp. C159]